MRTPVLSQTRNGVDRPPALSDQFGDIPLTARKIQVPTNTGQNNFRFVMSPGNGVLRGDRHKLSSYWTDHLAISQHNLRVYAAQRPVDTSFSSS